ncbi:unconventional myosin-Vc-like [Hyalella azteca]|uniref:Unconventional myosin-Vc-like n=1 Tax=Hyalella azteca TaxID=294128 RepID=A0A979FFA3_HYAAZ|nr:unconventional myosin-Vc-like [Hyalella azteca]
MDCALIGFALAQVDTQENLNAVMSAAASKSGEKTIVFAETLSDLAVWIYNGVIKLMEESIQPLVVPSILENEVMSGICVGKPGPAKGGAKNGGVEESSQEPQKALDLLLSQLTLFYRTLATFGTDPAGLQADILLYLRWFTEQSTAAEGHVPLV